MKKILGIIILSLLLSGNAHSVRQDGSGELKISYKTLQTFITYLRGSYNAKPMVFWVTADGQGSYYWYCPYGVACQSGGASREKQKCEDFHKGKECFNKLVFSVLKRKRRRDMTIATVKEREYPVRISKLEFLL